MIDATTTSVVVNNAALLGAIPNFTTLLIDNEQLLVKAVNGNTLTVARGVNGTTAAAHNDGESVSLATD